MTGSLEGGQKIYRASAACIAGAAWFQPVVLRQAAGNITGYPAIIASVRTLQEIDTPELQLWNPPASQTVKTNEAVQLQVRQSQG